MDLTVSYFKSAFREPANIAGLVLAGAATIACGATGAVNPAIILAASAAAEALYLITVPVSPFYRRIVNRRVRHQIDQNRRQQRLELIKTFDQREREAVEYLQWMKNQIAGNYRKFTRSSEEPEQLRELETAWEAFVDLLDEYRNRKLHLRTVNRQAIENQVRQAERTAHLVDPETRALQEKNVGILRQRLATYDEIERSVKRVETQLQMIENFFGLVNDQVVTMPTPERILTLDLDSLLSSIETTREILRQTAPIMGQIDALSRDTTRYRPASVGER